MTTQNFHGSVDQVAGRDIINITSPELWHWSTTDLLQEAKRCRAKLWRMRRDTALSGPFIWALAGLLMSLWMLLNDLKNADGSAAMYAWFVVMIAVPMSLLSHSLKGKGKMVRFYLHRIEIIDTILQDRT